MSYSVLSEPLIAVVPKSGASPVEVSLRDAVIHAHEYEDISGDSAVEQFAVLRFLSAFVMDMLAIKTADERRRIFQSGRFDEKTFDKYIALCKKEGATFDLFDPNTPFMQSVFTPEEQGKYLKAASNLNLFMPSGNSHTFFSWTPSVLGHAIEDEAAFTPPKAFRCLCARQTFCAYSLEGPKGISVMPLFLYTAGNTLFETIMMQTLSVEEAEAEGYMNYGLGSVPWRKNAKKVSIKEKTETATFLQALTWQPRMIQLKQSPDGLIHKVYLAGGLDYCGEEWKDINTYGVRYTDRKTGEVSVNTIRARYDQDQWLTLLDMAYNGDGLYEPSVCVKNLPALFNEKICGNISLRMCGVQKDIKNYILISVIEEETPLPETLQQGLSFIREFGRDVRLLAKTAFDIRIAARQLFKEKIKNPRAFDPLSFMCSMQFCQNARELLMTLTVDDIFMEAPPEEHAEKFCEGVKDAVQKTLRFMRDLNCSRAENMISMCEVEKRIRIALWKNIKSRKEEGDNGATDVGSGEDTPLE